MSLKKRGTFISGEGGIRTREPLWVTRFPSVRAKPDYATSPFSAGKLYHVLFRRQHLNLATIILSFVHSENPGSIRLNLVHAYIGGM